MKSVQEFEPAVIIYYVLANGLCAIDEFPNPSSLCFWWVLLFYFVSLMVCLRTEL